MAVRTKKCISLCIVLLMMITNAIPAFAASSDYQGHWAAQQIEKWMAKRIVSGDESGAFKPDSAITRAEFAAIISRLLNYQEKAENSFSDVSAKAWYEDAVLKAYKAGIITGYDGKFNPGGLITRQEAAVILAKAFDLKASDKKSADKFSDAASIAQWSKEQVSALVEKGYIAGRSGNKLEPLGNMTRAETVKLIDNIAGDLKNAAGTYTENTAGNLVVNTPGVVLRNMTVGGDLYLTQGIGSGEITLEGVTVKGRTIVRGAGENSIMLNNTFLTGSLLVIKTDGKVRIVAKGDSSIAVVQAASGVKLEEDDVTGKGFEKVELIEIASGQEVKLDGDFESIDVQAHGATIKVLGGTVGQIGLAQSATVEISGGKVSELVVGKQAAGSVIRIAKEATVLTMTANAAVEVKGAGTIQTANINAGKVIIETKPAVINVAKDVTATIGGQQVNGGSATPPAGNTGGSGNSGGGSGGGSSGDSDEDSGGGSSSITVTAPSSAGVSVSKGSIDFNYTFYNGSTSISYAQMLWAPYYLDINSSTVIIANDDPIRPFSSPAISLASLGVTDGTTEFQDLDEMVSEMDIPVQEGAVGVGIPQKIKLSLKSKTSVNGQAVSNPWTYDTGWISFSPAELKIFSLYGAVQALRVKDEHGIPITGEGLRNISGNLQLDTDDGMMGVGVTIEWHSSNTNVIDNNGIVTPPDHSPADVTLTATLTLDELSETKTFDVRVMAMNPGDADLSNIEITGGGILTPAFSADNLSYMVDLQGISASCIGIKATVHSPAYSDLNYGGYSTVSEAVYYKELEVGVNVIPITVTAQDHLTQKTYLLTVDKPSVNGTADEVMQMELSDMDIYDDARDLRVAFFKAADESNISEYRVLAAQSVADFVYADAVPSDYCISIPAAGESIYSVDFPQEAKDINGNPIKTGIEYSIAILSVADGTGANANAISSADSITLSPYFTVSFVNIEGSEAQFLISGAGDYTPSCGEGSINLLKADGSKADWKTFPGGSLEIILRTPSGFSNEAGDQITLSSGGLGLFNVSVSGRSTVDGWYGLDIMDQNGACRTVPFEVSSSGFSVVVKDFVLEGSGSGFAILPKSSGVPGTDFAATFAQGNVDLLNDSGSASEQTITGSSFSYRIVDYPGGNGDQVNVADNGQGQITVTVTDGGSDGSTNGYYLLRVKDTNTGRSKFIKFSVTNGCDVLFSAMDKEAFA